MCVVGVVVCSFAARFGFVVLVALVCLVRLVWVVSVLFESLPQALRTIAVVKVSRIL